MIDTPPHPTPAMQESPSSLIRKGQLSIIVKFIIGILVCLQGASVPIIGYLMGRWDTMSEVVRNLREDSALMKQRQDQFKETTDRIESKLDRILQERHQ